MACAASEESRDTPVTTGSIRASQAILATLIRLSPKRSFRETRGRQDTATILILAHKAGTLGISLRVNGLREVFRVAGGRAFQAGTASGSAAGSSARPPALGLQVCLTQPWSVASLSVEVA